MSGNTAEKISKKSSPHYTGHRARLRERFLKAGLDGLQEYEVLEMLLFASNPRGDVKPLAKALLEKYDSIGNVLNAEQKSLMDVKGITLASVSTLKLTREVGVTLLKNNLKERPAIHSWRDVLDYCFYQMAHLKNEEFGVLFLDRKNHLMEHKVLQRGTVDQTPVYPREIAKHALEIAASSVVMIHNHPSGDPTPSTADIRITNIVQSALEALGIELHDHIVIGHNRHVSLKAEGHI